MSDREGDDRLKRILAYSAIIHCSLLFLITLVWGGTEVPPSKTVRLHIEARMAAREGAAGQEEGERTIVPARGAFPRRSSKAADNKKSASPGDPSDRTPVREAEEDTLLARSAVEDNPPVESDFARNEAKGVLGDTAAQDAGVSGFASVMGRGLIYRPSITLPERYSYMGFAYTVYVDITVTEEGLVSMARVHTPSGDPELDRLLEQRARLYRFEPVRGIAGSQSGSIRFTIQPR